MGLISTVIAASYCFSYEVSAICCGLLDDACTYVSRKLQIKVIKHDEIRIIAESILNTVHNLVSTVIGECQIKQQDSKLVAVDVDHSKIDITYKHY